MDQKSILIHRRIAGAISACLAVGILVTAFFLTPGALIPESTSPAVNPPTQTGSPEPRGFFQSLFQSHPTAQGTTAETHASPGAQTSSVSTSMLQASSGIGLTPTPKITSRGNLPGPDEGGMYYFPTGEGTGGVPTATLYVIYHTPLPSPTLAPTATPSQTFTPKPTSTPKFSATPTKTPSLGTATTTITPTSTATSAAMVTPTAQLTPTPTATATDIPMLIPSGGFAYLSSSAEGSGRQVILAELPDAVSRIVADIPGGELCAWSPDGTSLLVQVPRQNSTVNDLEILALDGTLTPLTASLAGSSGCGDWLPDGSSIHFPYTDEIGITTLSSLDTTNGDLKEIYHNGSAISQSNVSPDGRWEVFVTGAGSERTLEILDLVSQTAKRNPFSNASEDSPRFSADSRTVLFSRYVDSSWDLFSLNLETLVETRLTNNLANERWPEETSDGQFLLFSSDAPGHYNIFLLKKGETIPLQMIPDELAQSQPLWQP